MLLNVTADVTKNSNGEILSEENCTSKTKQQTWQINLAVLMSEVINVSLYAFTAINLKAFLVTSSFGLTKQERKNYSSGERRKKGTSGFLYQYDLVLFRVVALVICIFFFCLAQLQRQKWTNLVLLYRWSLKHSEWFDAPNHEFTKHYSFLMVYVFCFQLLWFLLQLPREATLY